MLVEFSGSTLSLVQIEQCVLAPGLNYIKAYAGIGSYLSKGIGAAFFSA